MSTVKLVIHDLSFVKCAIDMLNFNLITFNITQLSPVKPVVSSDKEHNPIQSSFKYP